MQIFKILTLVFFALCLMSCAQIRSAIEKGQEKLYPNKTANKTTTHQKKATSAAKKQAETSAMLVFLRASIVASAVPAEIYEISDGAPEFLSEISNNTQVHHRVTPGEHVFMLVSDNSIDYLPVDVLPNLTYYTIVKPSMGAWKPSFSLLPVKQRPAEASGDGDSLFFDDDQVSEMLSAMTPIVRTPLPQASSLDAQVLDKHREEWQRWSASKSTKNKRLDERDGRPSGP